MGQAGVAVEDLFGLDPTAGLKRHDTTGLLWLLKGERVVALTATEVRLTSKLTYYKGAGAPC
jgi:hypothetical protein